MRDRIELALAAWGHHVFRHAWWSVSAFVLIMTAFVSQLPKIQVDTSTEGFLKRNDPVRIAYADFRNEFGRDEQAIIAIRTDAIFDLDFLAKLRSLHEEIESEVPKLVEVQSLLNARNTHGVEEGLVVEDLLEDWPQSAADVAAVRERALANPLYTGMLFSADETLTTILIKTETYSSLGQSEDDALGGFDADDAKDASGNPPPFLTGDENSEIVLALQSVIHRHQAPDFEIFLSGSPIMMHTLQRMMTNDMKKFTVLCIAMIAAVLSVLFRRVAGVVIPLVVAVSSLVATISFMAIAGLTVTLPVQILPPFMLAVGVGGTIHVLAIFFQARHAGKSKQDAVAHALGHSGLAIIMTSLTTAGGLISFAAADLAPIASFGVAATVGVFISLGFTLGLVPALIALLPMQSARTAGGWGMTLSRAILDRCGDIAIRHAGRVALAYAVLIGVALLGASRLGFTHEPLEWFPEDDDYRVASELLNDSLDGSMFLEVLIDTGVENGLHDPALMRGLDEMRLAASNVRTRSVHVGKTLSIADVLKETHQALNENRPEYYAIPGERQLVAQELLLFENSGSDDLDDFSDPLFSKARFNVKVPFADALEYEPFVEMAEAEFAGILGSHVEITTTGLLALLGRTFRAMTFSMAKTYVVAFAIITPLMILLIGSVRIGLISMIPNLTPILFALGFMGWVGLPLDLFTLLIGCIAIGLAVDDTIHFMHGFRRFRERTGDAVGAVKATLETTGQALLFTSLVLSGGFFVFTMASMHNLATFGLLTGFTILMAFLADVLLAPALMVLLYGRQSALATDAS